MEGQTVIRCPQCGGNKVKSSGVAKALLWFAVISAITIIGIPLAIVLFIAWAFARFAQKDNLRMVCMECKHMFKINRSTYEQYIHAVKENESHFN
ncbi:YccF domain-containing protein [Geobacillus sp. NFOSA3]|nr:YccF domain-containing protein [Geobacillus sp. NFOSA3]